MKVALIGGHFTPALAVIEKLQGKADIVFIGRKNALEGDKTVSLEHTTITGLGIPFLSLTTGRLQRRFTKHTIPSLLKLPYGVSQALRMLHKEKVDVVLGFGSYLSVPVCFAAKLLGIPIVIHEQTLEAGAANHTIAKIASKICISFETSLKYFPKEKTIVTGNPIRDAILHPQTNMKLPFSDSLPIVFITGGSSGSHAINVLIKESLSLLLQKYNVIHQTGDAKEFHDFSDLEQLRDSFSGEKKKRYWVTKFIAPHEIGFYFSKADICISRSGINTITELLYFEKRAILIPLPYSSKQEQLKNARYLAHKFDGIVLEQHLATRSTLLDALKTLSKLKVHESNKQKELHLHAAEHITDVVIEVVKRQK